MTNKELEIVKTKYSELLRDLPSNIRSGEIENIKDSIKNLILKTTSLKRKLEMD